MKKQHYQKVLEARLSGVPWIPENAVNFTWDMCEVYVRDSGAYRIKMGATA